MRKIILAVCMLAGIVSCKKDKVATCEVSVAGITGNYKITKLEAISSGITTDVTSTFLDDCGLSGVYQLKADKSVTYTETSSCAGDGTGIWDVVSGNITVIHSGDGYDYSNLPASFDCSKLVITENQVGSSYRYTLTKQ